jgi:predicted nucleic acid-binding protein
MIVVDSSVWIAHFRNQVSDAVRLLRSPEIADDVLVADIVLLEVLRGAQNDGRSARLEAALRVFPIVPVLGEFHALQAAQRYRTLRRLGVTMSKTPDLILASYCVEHGYTLLHQDRDFDRVSAQLGLSCLP